RYEGAATATINGIAISIISVIDYSYPGVIAAIAYTELTAIALKIMSRSAESRH
ncbi:MAG: hypothetical protein IGR91_08680, partial [Fischerella thermalis M66_A2018_004]|nr:hypothetical protein [Fischerella thermalis M66_A2018_004]